MALTNSGRDGFDAAVRERWLSANAMSLFTQRSPLLRHLMERGSFKSAGYGTVMREMLRVPVTSGPQLTGISDSFQEFTFSAMTGNTTASYPLSQYGIPVAVEDYHMKEAGGPEEMVNWRQNIYEAALERAYNTILSHFWEDEEAASGGSAGARTQLASLNVLLNCGGTSTTDGGANPPALAGTAPAASQVTTAALTTSGGTPITLVGGLERNAAGAAYWCTPIIGAGSGSVRSITVATFIQGAMACWNDGGPPDIAVMHPDIWGTLCNLLTVGGTNGGQIINDGQFGFPELRFNGIRIVADRRAKTTCFHTTNARGYNIYYINSKYLTMRMDGKKPTFKDKSVPAPIEAQLGTWCMALTSGHLGNVHARVIDATT